VVTRAKVLLSLGALVWVLVAATTRTLAQDASGSTPDGVASVPSALPGAAYTLTLWNGSPYLDLSIDGVPGRFLFDTGANVSGIDRSWLADSGIAWTSGVSGSLGGTTGDLALPSANLDRLDLGHGFFSSPTLYVEDFSGFGRPGGEAQAGLLGMDFIACYAVTLDLANGRASVALANERPAPSSDEVGLPLDLSKNLPTVTASLSGTSVPCRLDTGDAYLDPRPFVDVNRATVNALVAAGVDLVETGTISVAGVSGVETLPLLEASDPTQPLELVVGPVRIQGAVLVVHDQGTLAEDAPLALAGAGILSRLGTFRIDPFDQRLYLPSAH
jgi:hypothetical protein